ncbi:Transcriptional activator spt7 [Sorochytrium milnesiophthora]
MDALPSPLQIDENELASAVPFSLLVDEPADDGLQEENTVAAEEELRKRPLVSHLLPYLSSILAEVKGPSALKDDHLMSLLKTEIRRSSKWASDEWVGQEELYDALERVLNDLRNYEQLKVFHHKVQVREAPDYYHVIARPMDFSQMKKKLAQSAYKSKQEFLDDLKLIHDNCMQYNSHPQSIYREYARFLKDRADQFAKSIPDITIRHRSERLSSRPPVITATAVTITAGMLNGQAPAANLIKKNASALQPTTAFGTQLVIKFDPKTLASEQDVVLPAIPLPPSPFSPITADVDELYSDAFLQSSKYPSMSAAELQLMGTHAPTTQAIESSIHSWHQLRDVAQRIHVLKEEEIMKKPNTALPQLAPDRELFEESPLVDVSQLWLNEEASYYWLRRSICKLLFSAGFEGSTLNVVTDIVVRSMLNIGRTARVLEDRLSRKLSAEDIVHHVLEENGYTVTSLEDYINVDVIKSSRRLKDLSRRLEGRYRMLLMGEPGEPNMDMLVDLPLDGADDAFASGNFLEGLLGEDVLGLKSLGAEAAAVPSHLWYHDKDNPGVYRKVHRHKENISLDAAPLLEFPLPPSFPPVTAATSVIGLLQPFFDAKLTALSGSSSVANKASASSSSPNKDVLLTPRQTQQSRESPAAGDGPRSPLHTAAEPNGSGPLTPVTTLTPQRQAHESTPAKLELLALPEDEDLSYKVKRARLHEREVRVGMGTLKKVSKKSKAKVNKEAS